ncbi:MAG: hypothetical protein M3O91_03740 [Chloroflexota bacterium]|nr:hypothetical protein [Chloroflexota bacterium]
MSARTLHRDGTADCEACGLAAFPWKTLGRKLVLECANRHQMSVDLPAEPSARVVVDNWLSKRGAELHAQHERWGTDDRKGRDERDI